MILNSNPGFFGFFLEAVWFAGLTQVPRVHVEEKIVRVPKAPRGHLGRASSRPSGHRGTEGTIQARCGVANSLTTSLPYSSVQFGEAVLDLSAPLNRGYSTALRGLLKHYFWQLFRFGIETIQYKPFSRTVRMSEVRS